MPTSVDADGLAGNEVGLTEQDHRFRDFALTAPVANWGRLGDLVHFLPAHVGRRHNRTGGYGVHEDVVTRDLEGQRLREGDDARLGYVVRRKLGVARSAASNQPVGEIDDPAATGATHVWNGGVGAQKRRPQVHVEVGGPVVD